MYMILFTRKVKQVKVVIVEKVKYENIFISLPRCNYLNVA